MIDIDKIEAAAKFDKEADQVSMFRPATVLEMVSMIRERDAQVEQLQEQNTYLDKVAADLQELCDRQAKALGRVATSPVFSTGDAAVAYLHGYTKAADERDAVLKQALVALERTETYLSIEVNEAYGRDAHISTINEWQEKLAHHKGAIAAINGVLNERPD